MCVCVCVCVCVCLHIYLQIVLSGILHAITGGTARQPYVLKHFDI